MSKNDNVEWDVKKIVDSYKEADALRNKVNQFDPRQEAKVTKRVRRGSTRFEVRVRNIEKAEGVSS